MTDSDDSKGRTRRDFLRIGAATAAGATLVAGRPARAGELLVADPLPGEVRLDETDFPMGVAAGDVTPTRAMLWTFYEGRRRLRLTVWLEGRTPLREVARTDLTAGAHGALHVPVERLTPGARYEYAFYELEDGRPVARTRTGRFRAALADDALEPLTIGACACTRNGWDLSTLERAGERTDLDLFLHLGDTVYCDGSRSLADFRERWRENMATDGYRKLRASVSTLATWDDHEVTNDWLPDDTDPQIVQRARAAFFEHHPLARDPDAPDRIWRSRRWGKTLEVFVLDARSERTRRERPHYLSREQMSWLKDGLRRSPARFKLVMNSVPIARLPPVFAPNRKERWEFYPACRAEILGFIDGNDIRGVVWLSGDFHLASVGRASPDGFGWRALEVLAGPGAQFPNLRSAWMRGRQWDWAKSQNNYATLRFDPASGEVRVTHFGSDGRPIQDSRHRVG